MSEHGDWRHRRWEATHARIYGAALALFREHGFDRVNVGQIAAGAEVSVPTFYAHYHSKEHVVMQLPTREEIAALAAALPAELPLWERLRHAAPLWFSAWTTEELVAQQLRWRVIASEPALRRRAAEFERTTGEYLAAALGAESGTPLTAADAVVVNAYMAAYTAGLLAWGEADSRRKVEELIDEAFDALRR